MGVGASAVVTKEGVAKPVDNEVVEFKIKVPDGDEYVGRITSDCTLMFRPAFEDPNNPSDFKWREIAHTDDMDRIKIALRLREFAPDMLKKWQDCRRVHGHHRMFFVGNDVFVNNKDCSKVLRYEHGAWVDATAAQTAAVKSDPLYAADCEEVNLATAKVFRYEIEGKMHEYRILPGCVLQKKESSGTWQTMYSYLKSEENPYDFLETFQTANMTELAAAFEESCIRPHSLINFEGNVYRYAADGQLERQTPSEVWQVVPIPQGFPVPPALEPMPAAPRMPKTPVAPRKPTPKRVPTPQGPVPPPVQRSSPILQGQLTDFKVLKVPTDATASSFPWKGETYRVAAGCVLEKLVGCTWVTVTTGDEKPPQQIECERAAAAKLPLTRDGEFVREAPPALEKQGRTAKSVARGYDRTKREIEYDLEKAEREVRAKARKYRAEHTYRIRVTLRFLADTADGGRRQYLLPSAYLSSRAVKAALIKTVEANVAGDAQSFHYDVNRLDWVAPRDGCARFNLEIYVWQYTVPGTNEKDIAPIGVILDGLSNMNRSGTPIVPVPDTNVTAYIDAKAQIYNFK